MQASVSIRYLQVILFMIVYIALGFLLRLDATSYLLIGIPLTVIFQLFIAQKPLYKLWLRDSEKFQLNKSGWIITLGFLVFPIYQIIHLVVNDKLTLLNFGYYFAVIPGAFGAGYCYGNFTKKAVKDFLLCLGIIVIVRISFYFFPFLIGNHEFNPDYIKGIKSLLTYIPVAFVVEEVVFRGMLDTYIHQSKKANGVWSAIFISCIWGLWHLPLSMYRETSIWLMVVPSMIISSWGIILSIFWRRTGNLAVPAFPHAFADAIRDSLK